jgi:peptidoglycan/xylan/chitin deacetylase (PgdA/CDA1 family)
MYHRIAEEEIDPWRLCVSARHFDQHLQVLKERAHPMTLAGLAAAVGEGRYAKRAVVITFDDGYRDNATRAYPLLVRREVPATFFLTVGCIGSERPFWWDTLAEVLLRAELLPPELALSAGSVSETWRLGDACHYGAEDRLADCACDPWEGRASHRLRFFYRVWEWLRPLPDTDRDAALAEIERWSGIPRGRPAESRVMSTDEVLAIDAGGLVEIGAHSLTHAALPQLPEDAQRHEIVGSKSHLEDLLGHPVTSFAYPFGGHNAETATLVRDAGFARACTTRPGRVQTRADVYRLPRVAVADWDGEELARRLWRLGA